MIDRLKQMVLRKEPKKAAEYHRLRKGRESEGVAVDYLTRHGYSIVERNFRCRLGEIDIIARHGQDLVFVEVRSSHSAGTMDLAYSVDGRKQAKIIKAAQYYLQRFGHKPPFVRFDVVLVTMTPEPQIELIPDAFRPGDRYFR
jgi:putative endonuclease